MDLIPVISILIFFHLRLGRLKCLSIKIFSVLFISPNFLLRRGPGSSVGIVTDYGLDGPGSYPGGDEIFRPSRRPRGPPSLLYNGYRVFPGGKVRPGRAADHSPPSRAAVMEE